MLNDTYIRQSLEVELQVQFMLVPSNVRFCIYVLLSLRLMIGEAVLSCSSHVVHQGEQGQGIDGQRCPIHHGL